VGAVVAAVGIINQRAITTADDPSMKQVSLELKELSFLASDPPSAPSPVKGQFTFTHHS
jgi:hypothetical protein